MPDPCRLGAMNRQDSQSAGRGGGRQVHTDQIAALVPAAAAFTRCEVSHAKRATGGPPVNRYMHNPAASKEVTSFSLPRLKTTAEEYPAVSPPILVTNAPLFRLKAKT
ncbi:MAG TPA: hypothetical protein PK640_01075 [Verrucomicrobiota bacterium]|nr:hypothetical protein [Verrucomicrobiota bacterium]